MIHVDKIDPRLGEIRDCLYRVALRAIIIFEGKMLLVEEASGLYNLPGGGLDYGEEIEAALLRELYEELGIESTNVTISSEVIKIGHKGVLFNIPWMNVYYRVALSDNKAIKKAELAFKWVDTSELTTIRLTPPLEHDRDFLLVQF
jgi:8-oxo-dGTP pyrophosphatase MutT (NUDIX family)